MCKEGNVAYRGSCSQCGWTGQAQIDASVPCGQAKEQATEQLQATHDSCRSCAGKVKAQKEE